MSGRKTGEPLDGVSIGTSVSPATSTDTGGGCDPARSACAPGARTSNFVHRSTINSEAPPIGLASNHEPFCLDIICIRWSRISWTCLASCSWSRRNISTHSREFSCSASRFYFS